MQFTPTALASQIEEIAAAAQRMSGPDADLWQSRMDLVYGDMEGQRGVDFAAFAGRFDRHSTIIALETLYLLITRLISSSAFHPDPAAHLLDAGRLPGASLDAYLRHLAAGDSFSDFGVTGCDAPFPIDWLWSNDASVREGLRELIARVADRWDRDKLMIPGDDPFQFIHRQLFPSNLTHISGQFYSPPWLAELLLDDVGWNPDQSLVDPFCGSGIFLVTALRSALRHGVCPTEATRKLFGIDLHPFAASAAQANLALFIARHSPATRDEARIEVRCDDAILPAARQPRTPQADVVATNPPWVGWEYLSRPYRQSIEPAWIEHDLYQSRGMEASFLKEDLSNLAIVAAWQRYLRDGGKSVAVLRPSTMHSEIASRGVRRLSLAPNGTPMRLIQIRTFKDLRLFKSADTGVATWLVQKGRPTEFPVPVYEFQKRRPRWNPDPSMSLDEVRTQVRTIEKFAEPTCCDDAKSRWMIAGADQLRSLRRLRGSNHYTPRMGVFTGGANGVFYLRRSSDHPGTFRNLTGGARRKVPEVQVSLEQELVHSVARGRDITTWCCRPEVFLLLPHTADSQMYPIAEETLASDYPRCSRYLHSMRGPLRDRNGFAAWEKKIHRRHYYTLQRVGPYTFAPYKVCWRYIGREFVVCVVGSDPQGKIIVPNDKVMFIPMQQPDEAYFVAGVLSSSLVRSYVTSVIEKRQISTRVIKSLAIPDYDPACPLHQQIARGCQTGHNVLESDPRADVSHLKQQVDDQVEQLYSNS